MPVHSPRRSCWPLAALLLACLQSALAQEVVIQGLDTLGDQIRVEAVIKGLPPHAQVRLKVERRWSDSEQALPTRIDGRRHLWVRGGQSTTLTLPLLDPVIGSEGQNFEFRIVPERTRVHAASRWLTLGAGGLAIGSRIRSRQSYEAYLNATEQAEIDAQFDRAQSAQRTSIVAGGLTLGLGTTWKVLADRLWHHRSPPSTEISLRTATGDWRAWTTSESDVCRFKTSGSLPDTLETAQIVVLQEGSLCASVTQARSEWQSVFTGTFDIVARNQALEEVILTEQSLWLQGIIADEWQRKVGHLTGGQYTLLAHCESGSRSAEFRIIDNESGKETWQALGRRCDAQRFVDEVRLQIQQTP